MLPNKTGLLVIASALFLVACASGPRTDSIGSLGHEIDQSDRKNITPASVQKSRVIVQYSRFIRLFETVPDETMRREGMRRLAALQLQADRDDSIEKGQIALPQVISLFESLLEEYPHRQNDRLLYQLSREYEESGQQDAALNSLDRLVQKYPETRYFDEAQFRRGEILFVKRAYADAEQAYHAVVEFGSRSSFYEQAVYKKGWSQFKQSQYDQSVDSFMHLLDRKVMEDKLDISSLSKSQQEFLQDALHAISLSFSYQAGPFTADEFLSTRPKRVYEHLIFEELAKFYLDKKYYADSVKSYQTFVARNELHKRSPEFLIRVIDIYKQGGFSDLYIAATKDYVQRYGMKTKFWKLYAKQDFKSEIDALNKHLKELAQHYHSLAQKNHAKLDYREAQRWYRTWLAAFPYASEAAQVRFLLAEILYEDRQYAAAVLQYERTAYDYKKHPESAEAGYAALLAYDLQEKLLTGLEQHQWHRQAIDAAIRFANEFPEHPQASKVLTRATEKLFNLGEFEKAHQIASQIVLNPEDDALKLSAWVVIAHIEFEWGAFNSAEESYRNALALMPASNPARKALVDKQAVAVYRQGEISREKGDLESAVKHFSRVKQFQAGTGIVASAEYDAAAALITLRDWGKAAVVLEAFRKSNPEHQLQEEVTRKLAVVYMENGQHARAAEEFARISHLPGTEEYKLEALWQSADLYEQVNAKQQAKKIYKEFIKRFPQSLERAIEARQRLVELYQREDDEKSSRYWRKEIVRADKKAGKAATERTRYLAAKASFALAEPVFESYRKVQLTVPLKNSLKIKKQKMDQALKAYGETAAYQVPEVLTAATFRIAEIYQDLGLAIYNSERPPKLNEEELEQYDILLEEQAYPFEEKAIEFHEINVKRIAEGYYGVWVRKSLEQLKELLPVRYAKKERNDEIVETIF
ncbi:MAG: tetratricopeptide repeat protein [Gammaproteobacteria bacterium]|nr:tetratricopeptide repeat protein [Gammaproteobacteria bacterium]